MPIKIGEFMFRQKQKPLHHRLPFIDPNPPKSRLKRVLVATALALGALGIAGQIEKGRDAQ